MLLVNHATSVVKQYREIEQELLCHKDEGNTILPKYLELFNQRQDITSKNICFFNNAASRISDLALSTFLCLKNALCQIVRRLMGFMSIAEWCSGLHFVLENS